MLDPVIDDALNLIVFHVLDVNELVPLVVMEVGPVFLSLDILSELAPNVVHVEVIADKDGLFVLRAFKSLLKDEPVLVIISE